MLIISDFLVRKTLIGTCGSRFHIGLICHNFEVENVFFITCELLIVDEEPHVRSAYGYPLTYIIRDSV